MKKKTITRRVIGYEKQITPEKAIKQIAQLRRQITEMENRITIKKEKTLINVSKECTFKQEVSQGKIYAIYIFHRCWCVGSLWFRDFPDFRTNNKHFKIEWIEDGQIRILWDGKY